MKRSLSLMAAVGLVLVATSRTHAQNLLLNPGLDDPPVHEGTTATGWTLDTFRTMSGPAPTANFANFANHTPMPVPPPGRGLWYRAFVGSTDDPVQADLFQDVPGLPGVIYRMSGWAHFERFYPGGLDNLNEGTADETDDGPASPTDTFFALEFLDALNNVLPGSTSIELRANGQTNDPDPTDAREWMQHSIVATAPLGTVNVRVRTSMVDGVVNPGVNPQSAFVDDFSLTIVPEPASVALGLIGILGLMALVRRR